MSDVSHSGDMSRYGTTRKARPADAVWAAGVAATFSAIALAMVIPGSSAPDDDWTRGYEPCVTEDAAGPCYWDADERGNGEGRSFVVDGDVVTYIDDIDCDTRDEFTMGELAILDTDGVEAYMTYWDEQTDGLPWADADARVVELERAMQATTRDC